MFAIKYMKNEIKASTKIKKCAEVLIFLMMNKRDPLMMSRFLLFY